MPRRTPERKGEGGPTAEKPRKGRRKRKEKKNEGAPERRKGRRLMGVSSHVKHIP